MQMHVEQFDGLALTSRTPLAPNTNIHGTAFAGSLYAIEALTAWGLLYLLLKIANMDLAIVHASGQIDFAKPIHGDIVARSAIATEGDVEEIITTHLREPFAAKGRVKLNLTTEVITNGEVASRFSGVYLARPS